ncbi:hypothetical protein P154DRAFT_402156, partial [Amniculicola lignicola CBS 123094]
AATTLPVPAGLPSPRSPTLSDAGMILPDDPLRSYSPNPYVQRPPSPPTLLYKHANPSQHTVRLASAPQGRRGPSPQAKSPPLSQRSSHSTLRNMSDSHTPPRKPFARNDAIPSSPTIENTLGGHATEMWDDHQRLSSITSSSVHSEDLENMMKWPGFDSHGGFDDSGVVLDDDDDDDDDEPEHGHFAGDASAEDEMENDGWLDEQDDADADDDMYNSAALSRRAEMILANAKKRLNVMEGNLRGARQSLVVSPTFGTLKMAPELSHQLSSQRERDRRLYSGIGPIPPRPRAYQASPLSSNSSPGHSRVLSETSIANPYAPMNLSRLLPSKRASSAMGVGSGPWSPDGYGQGRFPIRESRSFEVVRERQPSGWASNEEREHSLHSGSRGSGSPPHALETLPEDDDDDDADAEGRTLQRRPSSTTLDLRSQMQDLKGRISSLKQRAVEDKMRRRSLQSLRTPSPFTCADTWYTGAEAYKNGTSPVSADGGVGTKTESAARNPLHSTPTSDPLTPKALPSQQNLAVQEVGHVDEHVHLEDGHDYAASHYEDAEDFQLDDTLDGQPLEVDDSDFVSVDDDHLGQAGESVYEDAVYEMPVAERHEDRVDAFDYEHFFLHSAMGTYNPSSRSSSSSDSADSIATTRPVTAIPVREPSTERNKRISYHQRNPSVDSVSTMASFATAAEEQSDEEDENEEMDQFSQNILPTSAMYATHSDVRANPATNLREANASPSQASNSSHGSSRGGLVNGLQTSKIYTILLETPGGSEPRLALSEEEKQLIYGLAASLQQVCTNLQNTAGDQYERKEWRRRLDEARRLLNGEEL